MGERGHPGPPGPPGEQGLPGVTGKEGTKVSFWKLPCQGNLFFSPRELVKTLCFLLILLDKWVIFQTNASLKPTRSDPFCLNLDRAVTRCRQCTEGMWDQTIPAPVESAFPCCPLLPETD